MSFNQQSEKNTYQDENELPTHGWPKKCSCTQSSRRLHLWAHIKVKGQNALPTEIPRNKPQDLCGYSIAFTPSLPKGKNKWAQRRKEADSSQALIFLLSPLCMTLKNKQKVYSKGVVWSIYSTGSYLGIFFLRIIQVRFLTYFFNLSFFPDIMSGQKYFTY